MIVFKIFVVLIVGILFLWSLLSIVNGFQLLKMAKQPAKFTLILIFFPIEIRSNTYFNGLYKIVQGLLFALILGYIAAGLPLSE